MFFSIITLSSQSFALVSWPGNWPLWCQLLLGLAAAEFGTYWRHRLFHQWHWGWRLHSVHHSSRRLYFLNATRFHFVDLCLSGLASTIPLALCGASTEIVILVAIFTGLHGNWQHANVRYKLGWLNWLISAAELHRWHHSSIIRHSNSNYGNNLIIWDALFGTRCLPKDPQNIDQFGLGKHDAVFPQTWWRQLFIPFQWKAMTASKVSQREPRSKGKILLLSAIACVLLYGFLSLIGSSLVPPVYTVSSEITISATPERSWKTLTDFEQYPAWNPYVVRVDGNLIPKERVTITLVSDLFEQPFVTSPTVVSVQSPNKFHWENGFSVPGIYDTRHYFVLQAIDNSITRFVQYEEYRGLLPWLLPDREDRMNATRKAYQSMNTSMQQRLENILP